MDVQFSFCDSQHFSVFPAYHYSYCGIHCSSNFSVSDVSSVCSDHSVAGNISVAHNFNLPGVSSIDGVSSAAGDFSVVSDLLLYMKVHLTLLTIRLLPKIPT